MTSISDDRIYVFISHSHKDVAYKEELKTQLAPYERKGLLKVWDDTRLEPGSHWRVEIEEAIKKTRIAILLISADFLASNFLAEEELPLLLAAAKAGAVIIPVILSACAFQETELAQFQTGNKPSKPLDLMRKGARAKTWVDIATKVNEELSKASELKPAWTSGSAEEDVRKLTPAAQLAGSPSRVVSLFEQFKGNKTLDYVIIDLGKEKKWLTSRLYIFAIMLVRMRGLRCFVFLETEDDIDQHFLGIASPRGVRWMLARRYPWLETAFAKAYILEPDQTTPMLRILSDSGALDPAVAQKLVYDFLTDPSIQQNLPSGMLPNPDDGEWESFKTKEGQQLWEHAKWLDATRLKHDLGNILQQDQSTWLKESPDVSRTEQARSILRRKVPFVALVDEEKRFRSLIDRQDFLERELERELANQQ